METRPSSEGQPDPVPEEELRSCSKRGARSSWGWSPAPPLPEMCSAPLPRKSLLLSPVCSAPLPGRASAPLPGRSRPHTGAFENALLLGRGPGDPLGRGARSYSEGSPGVPVLSQEEPDPLGRRTALHRGEESAPPGRGPRSPGEGKDRGVPREEEPRARCRCDDERSSSEEDPGPLQKGTGLLPGEDQAPPPAGPGSSPRRTGLPAGKEPASRGSPAGHPSELAELLPGELRVGRRRQGHRAGAERMPTTLPIR